MELALYGYGGHAREVAVQIGQPITFFVDDEYLTEETKPISEFDPTKYLIMVAVADSRDRFDMVQRLPKETQFFTFIHPTALIFDDNVQVGAGSFIGANSILTTNIKLGRHTILNRGNQIGPWRAGSGWAPYANDMAPHNDKGAVLPPPELQPGLKIERKDHEPVATKKTVNRRSTKRAAATA